MSLRTRFVLLAGAWIALVALLAAALALGYRDRLPDPMAGHWGPSGVPDNPLSFGLLVAIVVTMWAVIAGVCLAVALTGRQLWRRPTRAWVGAALAWGGVFVLGMMALTIWANLDAGHWREARQVSWQVLAVIAGALLAGWVGWLLARRGPDERAPRTEPRPPTLTLRPGERAVWVSSTSNPVLERLGIVLLAVAAALAGAMVFGLPGWTWIAVGGFVFSGLLGLAVSSIRVQVSDQGLAVSYGAWRWPTRRTPLSKIERAWSEERQPSDVGGWGYRGLPGSATLMIRAGECLVVRYASGGELGISVDDAERGAALVNGLVDARPVG